MKSCVLDCVSDPVMDPVMVSGGGGSPPAGATLAFHAATFNASTYEMQAQAIGTGTPTFTVDDGTLLPDADGVYVPITLNTAPWYGARWDAGTAYADDSGGTPLPEAPSLYSGPGLTNLLTYSNDQTNAAWSKVGAATATRNQTGLTGAANTATLLEDADTVLRNIAQNNVTVADNTNSVTGRAFIKKDAGDSDTRRIQWRLDGGTVKTGVIDFRIDTGAIIASQADNATINDAGDWWEVLFEIVKPGDGSTAYDYKLFPRTTTSVSNGTMVVANVELYDNATIEQAIGSSPIVTAGATVSQAQPGIDYDDANHSDTEGGYYFEFIPAIASSAMSGDTELLSLNAGADLAYYDGTNEDAESTDGTNTATRAQALTADTEYRISVAYGSSKLRVRVNGTWGTEGTYDGAFPAGSALEFLRAIGFVGQIRNVRRYSGSYDDCVTAIEALDP